jgi:uncharacterized UBP type Zn finger protein
MAENRKPTAASDTATAAASNDDDEETARRYQTLEHLVSIFGFDAAIAQTAIDAVGGSDVTRVYNYILDNNLAPDKGGPVTPIPTCPHVESLVSITLEQLPANVQDTVCSYHVSNNASNQDAAKGRFKSVTDDSGVCPRGENWLCLTCACVRCSRYINGHGLDHWKETKLIEQNGNDSSSIQTTGHALAVSLADLSVWCHECQNYLISHENAKLQPIVQRLEALKFGPEKQQQQQPVTKKAKVESNIAVKGA